MKKIIAVALLAIVFSTPAFSDDLKGKVEVCRHPTITDQTDRSPVELQAPIYLMQTKQSYDGDTDLWIEISGDITLGKKPSCIVTEGVVTRNTANAPAPKKGSIWQADATAKPGQYWGKKPIEKRVKVGDSYGLVIESDPSKGGDIQEVTLRGRVLEDFK